tara:strand:- start:88 stop:459 length:372 start_codon:yes stop_codon:yes gene_type:complete
MARINLISLSGNKFKDIGLQNIISLIVTNTDTTDITFDLAIGPKTLHNKTSDTGAFYVLKDIPIPLGSTFNWDSDNLLSSIGDNGGLISEYKDVKSRFESTKNLTFLIRLDTDFVGNVLIRRL